MTDDTIRREMDFLHQMLGTWHSQINAIAEREAAATIFQHPIPYENSELTKAKDRLIEKSAQVIERLQQLHNLLVSPKTAD